MNTGTAHIIHSVGVKLPQHGLPPSVTRKRKDAQTVATSEPIKWAVSFTVPCRVVSEANRRDHWGATYRRSQEQKKAVQVAWLTQPTWQVKFWRVPFTVALTHTGPKMDSDNLQRSFKAVRDEIARLLGVDDGDARVSWHYEQRRGNPGAEIRISGEA